MIKKGNEQAIDYLYVKYFKMMSNMIIKNSGTEYEARDIYQDALIVFWQKVIQDKLLLTSKISTYLYSICQNLWRKELEKKKRLSYEEKDGLQNDEQAYDQNEKNSLIAQCIDKLGDSCKKVLTYYYFDGLSMQDIADQLGFSSPDTAKTKKYKCKKELDKIVKSMYTKEDFMN